ncbi:MAG: hypothetical protein AA931_08645 [Peptococcaceae bacterium 1109]|nr:MAG: hypothetical protein AA931_08645 [Peptococcaceae bacterium 1109]
MSTGLPSSATVAVMVEGRIVYAEGFRMRDRALNLPMDLDTQFNIGSISKVFTAAGPLILARQFYVMGLRESSLRMNNDFWPITVRPTIVMKNGSAGANP